MIHWIHSEIAPLAEANSNMIWTGDESTWPSQLSHHKCQQLLHHPALLEQFLQEWLTSVAFPINTDPSDIPEFSYTKRMIKRIINDLTSSEEFPLEALSTFLEWTTLAQIEERYGPNPKPHTTQGTTGPSNEEGTGGEW
jgi:hypothetical protein